MPDPTAILPLLDAAIYAFHMPLFFMLAGVTFGLRPPDPLHPGLGKRAWRIFYALTLWTYAFLAMRALAGGGANAGGSWQDLRVLPLPPVAHFWFLWALLLNIVAFALARRLLRPLLGEAGFWGFGLALAAVLPFVIRLPDAFAPWFGPALQYASVFALGGLIGVTPLVRFVPGWPLAMLGAVLFCVGLWASLSGEWPIGAMTTGALLSVLLMLPLMFLAARFRQGWLTGALGFLGVISLAIYVMHTMFSAALRIVLLRAGVEDIALHLVLGTGIGVVGPAMAYIVLRRFRLLKIAALA